MDKKEPDFSRSTGVYAFVKFAFIAAVSGVGLEDVTVPGFMFFQHGGFVHHAGPAVIGETA